MNTTALEWIQSMIPTCVYIYSVFITIISIFSHHLKGKREGDREGDREWERERERERDKERGRNMAWERRLWSYGTWTNIG